MSLNYCNIIRIFIWHPEAHAEADAEADAEAETLSLSLCVHNFAGNERKIVPSALTMKREDIQVAYNARELRENW